MEFACSLKLAFMAALVRLSSQDIVPGLYFKNRFPCTLNRISLTPLALTIDFDFDAFEVPNPIMHWKLGLV